MMITPFDARFAPKEKENKPRVLPATGDPKEIQKAMVDDYRMPSPASIDLSFSALVLYITPMSVDLFKKKYAKIFEHFVLGPKADKLGGKDSKKKIKVQEAIIYVPELCACLPTPEDDKTYFQLIKKIQRKPGQSLKEAAKTFKAEEQQKKQFADLNRMIKQISRYPKAYYITGPDSNNKTELAMNTMVKVKFIHNFDFSHGLIVSVDSK